MTIATTTAATQWVIDAVVSRAQQACRETDVLVLAPRAQLPGVRADVERAMAALACWVLAWRNTERCGFETEQGTTCNVHFLTSDCAVPCTMRGIGGDFILVHCVDKMQDWVLFDVVAPLLLCAGTRIVYTGTPRADRPAPIEWSKLDDVV
jgi:hypothetical protein